MRIDVGIVNYNGGESLIKCVQSLVAIHDPLLAIFVIDNYSSDRSIQQLELLNLPVTILKLSENLGYAAACNALNKVFTADIIVYSNMDLIYDLNWSSELRSCFCRNKMYQAIASLIVHSDEPTINAMGIHFHRDLHPENIGSGLSLEGVEMVEKEVFGCYGAVIAFRKEVLDVIGEMEASFFLFYEETEWFWRFQLAGLSAIFCPTAIVYHKRSLSTGQGSLLKLYYPERNRIRALIRLAPVWYIPFTMVLSLLRFASITASGKLKKINSRKTPKITLVYTIVRAWIAALYWVPTDIRFRWNFFQNQNKTSRRSFITILNNYVIGS